MTTDIDEGSRERPSSRSGGTVPTSSAGPRSQFTGTVAGAITLARPARASGTTR